MKTALTLFLIALALFFTTRSAHAAISCTTPITSGFSTAYNGPGGTVLNATIGTVTFTCSSTSALDAATILLRANNGTNALGAQNRVRLGATANFLNYEGYKDNACAALWNRSCGAFRRACSEPRGGRA